MCSEEALVALPRHWSGELSPLFRYMSTCVCAPLLVSIAADVPLSSPIVDPQGEGGDGDGETISTGSGNSGHEDIEESSNGCSPHDDSDAVNSEVIRVQQRPGALPVYIVPHRSLSVSEWLRLPAVNRVDYEDTDEDEADKDQRSPAGLDLHVLECSRDKPLPTDVTVPVVCMADDDTLPVIMASILYQRRIWHVEEPLIGISFERYRSSISFHFGWTEAELVDGQCLVRMQL